MQCTGPQMLSGLYRLMLLSEDTLEVEESGSESAHQCLFLCPWASPLIFLCLSFPSVKWDYTNPNLRGLL